MKPLQPALIVGLGGSGIEIVRRFRKRLRSEYPDAKHVRFLGIDTDPQSQETENLPRLEQHEFHHAGQFQMSQYVGDGRIDNFPAIRTWWKGYKKLPYAYVASGAGQRRPVGRLALFVHFDDIREALTRQLQAIFKADSFASLPQEYRRRVTVYVVASTCGGTGTGMFLDMAYISRTLVPMIQPQVVPSVRSLLLMPSAFTGTGRVPESVHHSLRANAYGALVELDWCMTKTVRRGEVEYSTGATPFVASREALAFESCFLVGNQDSDGAVYGNWGEILERGSAHLQLTLASSLTQSGNSNLDNVESWMGTLPPAKGRAPVYSSMNADEIVLPSARVHSRWTKRFAEQLTDRLAEGARQGASAPTAVALRSLEDRPGFGFLSRMTMRDDIRSLVPSLADWEMQARQVDPESPDAEQLIRGAEALEQEARRAIERARVPDRVATASADSTAEIDDALRQLLSTASIGDALLFLRSIGEQLDKMLERTRDQRRSLPNDWLAEFATRVRGVKKGLLQKKESFAKDLSVEAGSALGKSALAWERVLRGQVLDSLSDVGAVPRLKAHLDARGTQLEQLRAFVQTAGTRIEALPDPVIAPGMLSAISDEEMDSAFEDPERQDSLTTLARAEVGLLLDIVRPTADSVTQNVYAIAVRAVHQVAQDFVANARISASAVAERLDRLRPMAVFTAEWNSLTQGNQASRPQRMALLGLPERMAEVEERERTIIGSLQVRSQETTVVRIADDDRVLMMAQHHGYPLFALAEIQRCRAALEGDEHGRDLRYTLPEEEARRWEIEPVAATKSAQWFAVALALGWIKADTVSRGYTYRDSDSSASAIVLNKDEADPARRRENARDAFLRRGFADSFEQNLRNELAAGSSKLHGRVQDWIRSELERSQQVGYPDVFMVDLNAAQEFADSIRWDGA